MNDHKIKVLKTILKYFQSDFKKLTNIGADPEFLELYKGIIDFISGIKENQLNKLIPSTDESIHRESLLDLSEEEIKNLPFDKIESLLGNKLTKRNILESIAKIKFGMTKGEISNYTSKAKLIDRMLQYLNNILTHESIIRQASGEIKDLNKL